MHKLNKIVIFLILLVGVFLIFLSINKNILAPTSLGTQESLVCIEGNCFIAQIASTDKEREKGLMFVKELPTNQGMLFSFPNKGNYPFWMKNTFISLDIIWIADDIVIDIVHNAKPCLENSCPLLSHDGQANYVLEINGNLANELSIEKGDTVLIDDSW